MEMSEIVGSSKRKKRRSSLLAASWMMDPIYLLDEMTIRLLFLPTQPMSFSSRCSMEAELLGSLPKGSNHIDAFFRQEKVTITQGLFHIFLSSIAAAAPDAERVRQRLTEAAEAAIATAVLASSSAASLYIYAKRPRGLLETFLQREQCLNAISIQK